MRRPIITLLVVVAMVALALAASTAGAAGPLAGYKVALDPGHGETATEVGATNTKFGLVERDVNWDVVAATASNLTGLGAQVLITRTENEYVDRPTRYARANAFGADVLISVHHNGSSDPGVDFTRTYYTQKSDQPIARAALKYLAAAFNPGDPSNGMSHDGFGMTVRPKMPSTLTEAWFLTNDARAAAYASDPAAMNDAEAQALADAIVEYRATAPGRKGR